MTPQQLADFDAACCKSMRAGDAYLDELLKGEHERRCGVRNGNKMVYVVQRMGADISNQGSVEDSIGELLKLTGVGKELRRLRKLHERLAPDKNRVPSAAWVVNAEKGSTQPPDVQALACLRLLQPKTTQRFLLPYAWITDMVSARLGALLAEHPVLMHPRLVWDADTAILKSRHSPCHWSGEPAPMVHSLYRAKGRWSLPSVHAGVKSSALEHFAQHPAVAAGIKARAPHLVESFPPANPFVWGKTLGDLAATATKSRVGFFGALLHIERLRHAKTQDRGLFADSKGMLNGIRHALSMAFGQSWQQKTVDGLVAERASFLEEMAKTPTMDRVVKQSLLLEDASRIFFDYSKLAMVRSGPAASVGVFTPAPDAMVRFSRLREALVSAGVASNQAHASYLVLMSLFPTESDKLNFSMYTGTSAATVEVAHDFVLQLEADGQPLAELSRLIRYHYSSSSWGQALDIIETERQMLETINAVRIPESAQGDAPVARCRMRSI